MRINKIQHALMFKSITCAWLQPISIKQTLSILSRSYKKPFLENGNHLYFNSDIETVLVVQYLWK